MSLADIDVEDGFAEEIERRFRMFNDAFMARLDCLEFLRSEFGTAYSFVTPGQRPGYLASQPAGWLKKSWAYREKGSTLMFKYSFLDFVNESPELARVPEIKESITRFLRERIKDQERVKHHALIDG